MLQKSHVTQLKLSKEREIDRERERERERLCLGRKDPADKRAVRGYAGAHSGAITIVAKSGADTSGT